MPARITLSRVLAVSAAALSLVGLVSNAVAQCDTVSNIQGIGAPPGVDGAVSSVVMWDPDGPNGTVGPLMVIGGHFNNAASLAVNNGLAGWDGAQFVSLPGITGYTSLLCSWDQDGAGPQIPRLVRISEGPDPIMAVCDGTSWSQFTQFLGGTVTALTTWDPDGAGPLPTWLIVGGVNLQVQGVGPANVLRYDGSTWGVIASITSNGAPTAVVQALTPWTPSIVSPADSLVVGGHFDHVGATPVSNIAYITRSGASFSVNAMLGGVGPATSQVKALTLWNAGESVKRLVIGGDFTTGAGGPGANGLIYYTGGPNFFGLISTSTQWNVRSLTMWDPDGAGPQGTRPVFVGSAQGLGQTVMNVDPSTGVGEVCFFSLDHGQATLNTLGVWDAAGDGLQPQWLFVGGSFAIATDPNTPPAAPGPRMNNVARVGTVREWLSCPHVDTDGAVSAVASVSNLLTTNPSGTFVGGSFSFAQENQVRNLAMLANSAWFSGPGIGGPVNALTPIRFGSGVHATSTVVAGGAFSFVSAGATVNNICQLSGGPITTYSWVPLGSGVNSAVKAIVQFDPDGAGPLPNCIIAGGSFTAAGGATANHLAYYNSTAGTWGTLGTGFNGDINAMALWDPDGTGPLAARLVAGGNFTTASGIGISHLAYWDSVQWQPFEGGAIDGTVNTLFVWPDPADPTHPRLVVGGSFAHAGGTNAHNVALWRTGSGWDASVRAGVTGAATNTGVYCLAAADIDGTNSAGSLGASLFAGGNFTANGQGDPLASVARWDAVAQRWTSMGEFTCPNGAAVQMIRANPVSAAERPSLMIGGSFYRATGTSYYSGVVNWSSLAPYVAALPPANNPGSTSGIICRGSTAQLSATVLGTGLVYRWQRNGVNLLDGPSAGGSVLSGVTASTMEIANSSPSDNGAYTLTVFSPCGNLTTTPVALNVVICCGSADFNCDGDVATDADIEAFFACVAGSCPSCNGQLQTADFDNDGDSATDADIEAFFRVLAGGSC
jgi:hypothetical protein